MILITCAACRPTGPQRAAMANVRQDIVGPLASMTTGLAAKQMCKKIHHGGNAEQYNADKKYKEAVAIRPVEGVGAEDRGKLGGAHPLTAAIERDLQKARAAFRARETRVAGENGGATFLNSIRIAMSG